MQITHDKALLKKLQVTLTITFLLLPANELFAVHFDNKSKTPSSLMTSPKHHIEKQKKPVNYAKDRFIVKFKSEGPKALSQDAQKLLENRKKFKDALADGSDSLDKLNKKFKIKRAKSLFISRYGLSTENTRLKIQESLANSKTKYPKRLKRAPENSDSADLSNVYVFELTEDSNINVKEAVRHYSNDPHVDFAMPDYQMELYLNPNDPYYSDQYSLSTDKMNMEPSWDIADGEGITIAVVDTGVDFTHPDIEHNIWINPGEIPSGVDGILNGENPDGVITLDELIEFGLIDTDASGDLGLEDLFDSTIAVINDPFSPPTYVQGPGIFMNGIDNDGNGYVDDMIGFNFAGSQDNNGDGDYSDPEDVSNAFPMDQHGHGTHVAGIIAAEGNNGIGIIGVAPKSKIIPINGLDQFGSGYSSDLANSIMYAALQGADIINNSWGSGIQNYVNPLFESAISTAHELGTIVVFAAGNSGRDTKYYSPQNMQETIVIGSTDQSDTRSFFSNYGEYVDVSAPGEDILSLNSRGGDNRIVLSECGPACVYAQDPDYLVLSGTSMAAPNAAGVIAQILQKNPNYSADAIRQFFRHTSEPVSLHLFDTFPEPSGSIYGFGRIDAHNVLNVNSVQTVKITNPYHRSIHESSENQININGMAYGQNFSHYELYYRLNGLKYIEDPDVAGHLMATFTDWIPICNDNYPPCPVNTPVEPQFDVDGNIIEDTNLLGALNIDSLEAGPYILNLRAVGADDLEYEGSVNFNIDVPKNKLSSQIVSDVSISDSLVVFDTKGAGKNIILVDLENEQEIQITNDAGLHFQPDVSAPFVVWASAYYDPSQPIDYELDLIQICEYEPDNPDQKCIANTIQELTLGSYSGPSISGNRIAWDEYVDGTNFSDIYYCEYIGGMCNKQAVYEGPGAQWKTQIDGDLIVWETSVPGQIYVHDLLSGETLQITDSVAYHINPEISGNRIVWDNSSAGTIEYCDYTRDPEPACPIHTFTTGEASIDSRMNSPRIYYDLLTFVASDQEPKIDATPPQDVYLYNFTDSSLQKLTKDYFYQTSPAVSDRFVVWKAEINDRDQLFYTDKEPIELTPIGSHSLQENEMISFSVKVKENSERILKFRADPLPKGSRFVPAGDINLNGYLEEADGSLIQQYAVGSVELSQMQLAVGDINEDGVINTSDAALVYSTVDGSRLLDQYVFAWIPSYLQSGQYFIKFEVSATKPAFNSIYLPETVSINVVDVPDPDNDDIIDIQDNCIDVYNPGQKDTDQDGYGNICDCDVWNNGKCNLYDAQAFAWCRIYAMDPAHNLHQTCIERTDMNGNGSMDQEDADIFNAMFPGGPSSPNYLPPIPPGESGYHCAGTIPCPVPIDPAEIITPLPGSTLTGSTAIVSWNPSSLPYAQYELTAGYVQGGNDFFVDYNEGNTYAYVAALPAGNYQIFIRLETIDTLTGRTEYIDYIYEHQ